MRLVRCTGQLTGSIVRAEEAGSDDANLGQVRVNIPRSNMLCNQLQLPLLGRVLTVPQCDANGHYQKIVGRTLSYEY